MLPGHPKPARPPGCGARFFRGHGLGNDYLIFRSGKDWTATAAAVIAVCDRHRGLGGDGIIRVGAPVDGVFPLRGFNADGSEFERSGNGLRVFATAMAVEGAVGRERFEARIGGETVWLRVGEEGADGTRRVTAGMGRVSTDPGNAHFDPAALDGAGRLTLPGGRAPRCRVVSVGNPHCVVFGEPLEDGSLAELGPAIARHPAFARGTNVQLVEPTGSGRIRILIWERGVGRTPSSGTSSCASAVAAIDAGLVDGPRVVVEMEGGEFEVEVGPGREAVLHGPVQAVSSGRLDPGFLASLP